MNGDSGEVLVYEPRLLCDGEWGLAFLEGQGIAAFDGGALQDVVGDICQLVIEVRGIHRAGARLNFRVTRLD